VTDWHRATAAVFSCAGRRVLVTLLPLPGEDGRPRWEVEWGSVPTCLPPGWIGEFEAGLKATQTAILQRVARSLEAST